MNCDVSHLANGWPAALAMVRAGLGVTVGPSCLRQFTLRGIRFHDLPFEAELSTLWMLGSTSATSVAARAFCETLRKFALELAKPPSASHSALSH
jgi:DNA-binding transcriptional LysR family regulator